MKKSILIATCLASVSAYALPTYEPFTEYASAITATGTNSVDLATGQLSVTTGSVVEKWSSLNFSGQGDSPMKSTAPTAVGWDIQVTNFSGSVFTPTALSAILPSGFPGAAGTQVCAFIPYNTINTNNSVGNSAVLNFSRIMTRPTTGVNTIFISYLLDISAAGSSGSGNVGRYCAFLQSSNLVEGLGTSGYYATWQSMFNTFSATSGPKYIAYGVKTGFTGGGDWLLASDSAGSDTPATELAGIGSAYNKAAFVVSAFLLTPGNGIEDTNLLWVNPSTSTFGGPAIPSAPYSYTMTNIAVTDVGGFCLESRVGGGTAGGNGNTYMANLIVGTTWSYVTGGPEFTSQPANAIVAVGANVTLNGAAQAAGQSVAYQWQKIVSGSPVNINNGNGNAGGTATVSGATTGSLTLTDASTGDAGTYQLLATAGGTGFTLTTSNVTVTIADPEILTQPVSTTVNAKTTATFSASIQTVYPSVTYAWYDGSTMLVNGLQSDGSMATGAQGTNSANTFTTTLTLANTSYLDNGNYYLVATNAQGASVTSSVVTLFVNDPYIVTQPPATVEIAQGGTYTIPVVVAGTSPAYQWNNAFGPLSNSGDDTGVTTSTLTISGAQTSDAGTYNVTITGVSNTLTSSNVTVVFDTAIGSAAVTPPALTQQVGTHLAIIGTAAGGTGLVNFIWQRNGVTLANGTQADNSVVSGEGAVTPAATAVSPLVLSNLQVADSGTYTLIASNAAGVVSASGSCVVSITAGLLPLSTTNLEVTRVGEGSQSLSGATGNTLYLDQVTTKGTYVSTIMVPDSGSKALIVPGGGNDAQNESYLTLSSNSSYLNLAGYCWSYPYTLGTDVTLGQQGTGGTTSDIRGIVAVNGLGYLVMAYTNYGLYSGGSHYIRGAYSTDGLTNFWTAGAAGSGAVKYVNAGPLGSAYADGAGVPGLGGAGIVNGVTCVGLCGANLVFSDNLYPGDTNLTIGISGGPPFYAVGLDIFPGAPEPSQNGSVTTQTNMIYSASPADFVFSPDVNTAYIADSSAQVAGGAGYGGGVQRWDLINGVYTYQYNLEDTTSTLATPTNGMRGVTVYFPPQTYGQGVTGAVIYATSSEAVSNRLVAFTDNGPGSPSTLLETAGPNQFLRGVRFGPAQVPVSIATAPLADTTYIGQSDTLTVTAAGDGPISYQWQFDGTNISGATNSSLVLTDLQASQAGTYSVIVYDPISTNSSSAVISVSSGPPILLSAPQSRIETAGDHLAFSVGVTGTLPLYYQWSFNGSPIAGATNSSVGLSNIVSTNSGTYSVVYSNMFGTNTQSATLQVTTNLQSLSSANLVVARVGDGAEPLSITTGNTLYLDQLTTAGVYSNTIMIPDNVATSALIVRGDVTNGPLGSVLTRSTNNTFLNFIGYHTEYPNESSPAFQTTSPGNASDVIRGFGAVNAFGYYQLVQTNQTLYAAPPFAVDSAVSLDGFGEFWTTGDSTGDGVKYVIPAYSGTTGGNVSIGGSAAGPRVVKIVGTNLVYSDAGSLPAGIWGFAGEPIVTATPSLLITDAAGNPNDFAASPDTTNFPPTTSTVYVGDSSTFAGGGGIQRYDWNGAAYTLSYTLGAGAGSTNGASCLVVDFSANANWGTGVTGAIIYATTAGAFSNSLIKIVDTGAASTATVLDTANLNEILRGVRFGPVASGPIFTTNPLPQSNYVGTTAVFKVANQNGPILSYQWQLNGQNLANGSSPSGSGAVISGAQTSTLTVTDVGAADDQGIYTVIVSNPYGPATSASALLTVPVKITVLPPLLEYVTNGGTAHLTVTATGGAPLSYQWTGPCGLIQNGPGGDPCNGSAVVSGANTSALVIAGVTTADNGSYTVTISNPDPSSTNNLTSPSVLTVVTAPQFNSAGPITGVGTAPQLNFSGQAGTAYSIWATTNLSLTPVTSTWTRLGGGTFSGGQDSFAITAPLLYRFYTITQP